jgi:hypothetical protein
MLLRLLLEELQRSLHEDSLAEWSARRSAIGSVSYTFLSRNSALLLTLAILMDAV